MKYTILIQRPAEKFITKLPRPEKERVLRAIAKLPYEGDRKAMQGHPGFSACGWGPSASSTPWTTGSWLCA